MRICLDGANRLIEVGYSDTDWSGDVKDMKPVNGYVYMMSGGPVSWCSQKQTVVVTSTYEAEYIAF